MGRAGAGSCGFGTYREVDSELELELDAVVGTVEGEELELGPDPVILILEGVKLDPEVFIVTGVELELMNLILKSLINSRSLASNWNWMNLLPKSSWSLLWN